jgi:nucleoside-diphosphate-sugar epimerase
VKRDRRTGSILPRGDVLRCHLTDCAANEEDPVAIYIDDEEYTLREFGQMLRMHAGWGMRVVFVPEDSVREEPVIEVRMPKRSR